MTIKKWQAEIHRLAVEKGWWVGGVTDRSVGDQFANFHAELSEAWEEYRKSGTVPTWYTNTEHPDKPEGLCIELADCVIRILDTCDAYGIDLEAAMKRKHAYNKGRPYRHGGKKA